MKKKGNILYGTLFGILMVLLFLPLAQEHLNLFEMKPLKGVFEPADEPELTFENYASGKWQAQVEPYIGERFGFREFVIRLYNQYLLDFYSKTYSGEVSVGKDGWLYQQDGINQYYGLMNSRYNRTNEQFKNALDIEMRSLVKIRAILKEYDVEFMTFTLPVKSLLYPEHLRPHHYEDTLFHAGEYLSRQLDTLGFPHIYMTPWFQQLQEEYPFTLFYEKGSHWASGAVIATDSLLRYMESLKGERFPRIAMGDPYLVDEKEISHKDYDLAELLNTLRLPRQRTPLYEIPVSIVADSNSVYPNVLFAGTSYYWYMVARVPFSKVFRNRDFMYYNYYYVSNEEKLWRKMEEVNTLAELLTHDYVVYFRNEPQLYLDGFHFIGRSLIALCISDERLAEKTNQVTDSLALALQDEHPDWNRGDFRYRAKNLLLGNPEMFEELRGEAIPSVRNPKIRNVLAERDIRADHEWCFLLDTKALYDSVDNASLYAQETNNVLNGTPLIRNRVYFTTYDYFDFLVNETVKEISRQPESATDRLELVRSALSEVEARVQRHEFDHDSLMLVACAMDELCQRLSTNDALANIREKAAQRRISTDKMFRNDVVWLQQNQNLPINTDRIPIGFERYKIERQLRRSPQAMEKVTNKCRERDLPFRVAINGEITWIMNRHS